MKLKGQTASVIFTTLRMKRMMNCEDKCNNFNNIWHVFNLWDMMHQTMDQMRNIQMKRKKSISFIVIIARHSIVLEGTMNFNENSISKLIFRNSKGEFIQMNLIIYWLVAYGIVNRIPNHCNVKIVAIKSMKRLNLVGTS